MHGRKCLLLAALILTISGCSAKSIMKPDCHSCTAEDQEWNAFSWQDLSGHWKGSVETFVSEKDSKKREKKQSKAELRFLGAKQFLQAHGNAVCASLPENAVILNGVLWNATGKPVAGEYEAFVPVDKNKVAYGRISFENLNGQKVCHFRRLGAVMGKNRLALPSVSFSEYGNGGAGGRALASLGKETEVSVEFLRFSPMNAKAVAFQADGRGPASAEEKERPPLIIRVYKASSRNGGERGQWSGSEEQLYRLWRAE